MRDEEYRAGKKIDFIEYCRLSMSFPTYDLDEKIAAEAVIQEFKTRYGGSTYSAVAKDTFVGAWLDDSVPPVPAEGYVSTLTIDAPFSLTATKKVTDAIDLIREYAVKVYRDEGVPQMEFWITASPIMVRIQVEDKERS